MYVCVCVGCVCVCVCVGRVSHTLYVMGTAQAADCAMSCNATLCNAGNDACLDELVVKYEKVDTAGRTARQAAQAQLIINWGVTCTATPLTEPAP